jgi:hypothetical protein
MGEGRFAFGFVMTKCRRGSRPIALPSGRKIARGRNGSTIPARDKMGEKQVRADITKEESAHRQIETAINLFFCEGDEISIHVLANSAAQILTDVCKAKNVKFFVTNSWNV